VVVVRRTGAKIVWNNDRDHGYQDVTRAASPVCAPEPMSAEDPLFILYTSGSTGKPKGVLHTSGGYLLFASLTHKYVFDYHDGDMYWCAADVGWVTGHSYIVYGPRSSTSTARSSTARPQAISCCSPAGPARCARSTAITSASSTRTSSSTRASISPATAHAATRTATTGSRAASTT